MKTLHILTILFIFLLPVTGFSQSGIDKLKELTNTLIQPQDTSKKSSGTGGSNLAVSDEGASGGKGKSQKTIENPIEKLKHNLTEKAVENEKKGSENNGSPAGTSNLAVSDEGASGKGKNNSRETGTTGTTPAVTDPPKTGTTSAGDPK